MNFLITGANRGIGLELTKQLLIDKSHAVIATARRPAGAEELNSLAQNHSNLSVYPLDINDTEQISALANQLKDQPIDYLINNAGQMSDNIPFENTCVEDIVGDFMTNTVGTFLMCQKFLPHVERSEKRFIVNMTSRMGSIGDNESGGTYAYRMSKAALNMMTRSLAIDLREKGITAFVLHPGWALTAMGGPNALISIEESVQGILQVLKMVTVSDSGRFLNYMGEELAW